MLFRSRTSRASKLTSQKLPPKQCAFLRILASSLFLLFFVATCLAKPPKVIIDTDFNTMGDDGQVAVMAAQLYAQGAIDLLGFTIPTGNQWRDQEVSDCLKTVERMGIEPRVHVYIGAQYPLLHDYNSYQLELILFGPATQLCRRLPVTRSLAPAPGPPTRWLCYAYKARHGRCGSLYHRDDSSLSSRGNNSRDRTA